MGASLATGTGIALTQRRMAQPVVRRRGWADWEADAVRAVARYAPHLVRGALSIVFLWFGALKLASASPVAELVSRTLPWFPADSAVIGVGALEVVIGLAFLSGRALRVALVLFFVQMAGTFLTFVAVPEQCFQGGHVLLLSTTGEFVFKNVVLMAAGLVVVGTLPPPAR